MNEKESETYFKKEKKNQRIVAKTILKLEMF